LHPLRERPGDILPLVRHFIRSYSQRLGYGEVQLSSEAERKLAGYDWHGNIRELENVIHHRLLVCHDGLIRQEDLRLANIRVERSNPAETPTRDSADELLQRAFQKLFEEQGGALHEKVEKALLRSAYHFCHHNQVHTANLLGLSRNVTRAMLIKAGELVVNKRRPVQSLKGDQVVNLSI
jgi:transcriptional regulator with AAA-type ATPase domain